MESQAQRETISFPKETRFVDNRLIEVTEASLKKLWELAEREKAQPLLRIAITGGGCNGLTYKLKFIQIPKKGDLIVEFSGFYIVVDSKSALYLKGTHLDYSSNMIAGGFKFSNPNATSSCSCGESFSM